MPSTKPISIGMQEEGIPLFDGLFSTMILALGLQDLRRRKPTVFAGSFSTAEISFPA